MSIRHVKKQDSGLSKDIDSVQSQLPTFTPPQFTIKELLNAIPKHCYERSALKSSAYTIVELLVIAGLFYAASYIDVLFGVKGELVNGYFGEGARWAGWLAYWWWQGLVMTGIWIVGHECGHQAFSASKFINNTVGFFLHSALFVPYHSWRISHGRHHAATGHLTRDEVFVPKTRSYLGIAKEGEEKHTGIFSTVKNGLRKGEMMEEIIEDAPVYRFLLLIMQQLLGWPLYLFMNASGQKHFPKWTNHFSPESFIFKPSEYWQIILSDIGMVMMGSVLYWVGRANDGFVEVAGVQIPYGWGLGALGVWKYYGIPYLCVNHWLVMITYLQHTDPYLPHYTNNEWTFPRGALCTVDRNLLGSFIGPYILHGICETHVAHHVHSKIPHYNAWEATEALKAFLGPHYMYDSRNMFAALWSNYRACRFVEDDEDVVFYKDAHGQASRVLAPAEKDSGVEL